jgi:hypothetical protein
MSFGYNELKVLKSFCEEFQEENFEIYKSNNLFCVKVWFGTSSFEALTSSLTISFISEEKLKKEELYIIFNIDKDNELQLNFKKSIVSGDRNFDIIKKFTKKDKQIKSIKLLLQLIIDKKLFKKYFETISKEKAIEFSKDSHGIFQDQKNKKDVDKKEIVIEKENVQILENKEKEENKTNNNEDDISLDELSEVAVKELFVLLSYKLGNIKKMVEKKVVDAMSKSMYKYIIKQIINITLQTAGVDDKRLANDILIKCKNAGCFNKNKHSKQSNPSSDVKKINPYIEFSKKMRPQIKRDNPNMKGTEIVQMIAKLWNQKKGE